jgi:hypothetical protein
MDELYSYIFMKYKKFIKNDLLYFEDLILNLIDHKRVDANTVESYYDSTVPDEDEIAVLKINEKFSKIYKNNKYDILEIKDEKYIIGFLYPSEFMEKENTYNFKSFWIYKNKNKEELRLSSFTMISDIVLKKNNRNNKINIIFDKDNFNEIDEIIIIKVEDLIKSH